jgi:cysteine synthase B
MGVARKLKEYDKTVKIIGVQPSQPNSKQQGLLNPQEFRPEIFDPEEIDEVVLVDDVDALRTARELLVKEGLFAGVSSGAVMYGAMKKKQEK